MTNSSLYKRKMAGFIKFMAKANVIQVLVSFVIVAVNSIFALILSLTVADGKGGFSADAIFLIYALVLGIVMYAVSFRFAIMNGLTRPMYFVATLSIIFGAAVIWSVANSLLALLPSSLIRINNIFPQIYGAGYWSGLVWMLAATFLCGMIGWLIAVVMAQTSGKQKIIIFGAIVLIVPIYSFVNVLSNGAAVRGLVTVLQGMVGFINGQALPFVAAGIFLGVAAVIGGGILLLIRRANAA